MKILVTRICGVMKLNQFGTSGNAMNTSKLTSRNIATNWKIYGIMKILQFETWHNTMKAEEYVCWILMKATKGDTRIWKEIS